MATTTARVGQPVKNDGGTLRNGGNINTSTNPITNSPTIDELGYNSGKYGSHLETGALVGVGRVTSGGTFGKMTAGAYLMKGVGVTTTIAGQANTVLYFGASDFGRNSIHRSERDRRTHLDAWTWTADKDGAPTYTATRVTTNTVFSNDEAARPTRAVPGELVYRDGSPLPIQDEYQAKTS